MNWLNNMGNKFRSFMQGRYGSDQLCLALLIVSILLSFLSPLTGSPIVAIISYIPLILCIYRMFSKNISKRYEENRKFMNFWHPIWQKILGFKNKVQKKVTQLKDKDHKYYKCPNCKKTLRVPKGRGNIRITCPKCHHEFSKRT
nr:hypothetical protein [uncultured Cellulosilyticum sp.]